MSLSIDAKYSPLYLSTILTLMVCIFPWCFDLQNSWSDCDTFHFSPEKWGECTSLNYYFAAGGVLNALCFFFSFFLSFPKLSLCLVMLVAVRPGLSEILCMLLCYLILVVMFCYSHEECQRKDQDFLSPRSRKCHIAGTRLKTALFLHMNHLLRHKHTALQKKIIWLNIYRYWFTYW